MSQHFLLSANARTISLKSILSLSDAAAWEVFQRIRWPETHGAPVCPHCGHGRCYDVTRGATPRFRCTACRKDFSPTSGTLFAYHKLSIRDYLAAVVLFVNAVKGISALQMGRDLDVSYKSAWVLCHKLREAMASEMKGAVIGGEGKIVEVDGMYTGGHIRPENYKEDRVDRRLAKNQNGKRKVVVTIRERGGRTLAGVFRSEEESASFIKGRVAKGTKVHTDEAATWDGLRSKFNLNQVNHTFSYSHQGACTNQAESYFSRLRRAEWGQHHRISDLYLIRYAAEMGWREDHRRQPNGTLVSLVTGLAMKCGKSVDFTGYWQR